MEKNKVGIFVLGVVHACMSHTFFSKNVCPPSVTIEIVSSPSSGGKQHHTWCIENL